jgi:cytochrome c biogenesis protein CcdA
MKEFLKGHYFVTTSKGIFGMSATGGSFYVSTLPEIEAWLRVISLIVGIAVGVGTLVSIIRHKKENRK